MRIQFLTQESFRSMRANKLRTALTVLGVLIGIATIIIVFSAGEGIYRLVAGEVEAFGTDIIQTEVKVPTSKSGFASERQSATNLVQGVQITTLTLDDLEDIEALPNVRDGYAAILDQEVVQKGREVKKALVFGTSASYINIDASKLASGRFFSRIEDRTLAPVIVLGDAVKDKLFGESDPVGQTIAIRNISFRVIGVMEERGAAFGVDFDDYIYMPVRTLQKRIMGVEHVSFMVHRLYDADIADQTAASARIILRNNHGIAPPEETESGVFDTGRDDFRVVTSDEMLEILGTITTALTILIVGIVGVSLIVGGVGVMNVMYVIVNERTSEIGLRKAVGARPKDIVRQFLVESVIITLVGGVAGIVVGVCVAYGIAVGARAYDLDWEFVVPLRAFVTALLFSVLFGIFFGVYPARKAAAMDPVDALRSE